MNIISNIQQRMLQLAAFVFVAGLVVAMPQTAAANTSANAKILNVVTVDYKDASGVTAYQETASSTVTVNLVVAAPTISAPVDVYTTSGGTASYVYTVTSNANGSDQYNITTANTTVNATANSVTATPATLTLGSSVIMANTATTVSVPADSYANLTVGDVVVVGGTDYKISAIAPGSLATHTNASTTDGVAGVTSAEVLTVITLAANNTAASATTVAGSNIAPALGALPAGSLVAEQGTFVLDVTGTVTGTGTGTVTTTVSIDSNTTPLITPPTDQTISHYSGPQITITKEVSTDGGLTFAASGTGAPGNTLTYRITVTNAGGGAATSVVVTDPMPLYTTYTAGTAKLNTALSTYAVAPTVLTDVVDVADAYDFNTVSKTATLNIGGLAAAATSVLFYQVTID